VNYEEAFESDSGHTVILSTHLKINILEIYYRRVKNKGKDNPVTGHGGP
jgi:hypothetical protein